MKNLSAAIRTDKITELISSEINKYKKETRIEEIGTVVEAGDGIARITGLSRAMSGEMLEFEGGIYGQALNLDKNEIGAIILGESTEIEEGTQVKCTDRILEVPVGEALLGRIIDPLGRPVDNKGQIKTDDFRPIEYKAPSVINRQPVKEPLQTGIKAIDSMIPIGKGQRELVIGDRTTGKTSILVDTIINQKGKDVFCIYVAIGQKTSNIARLAEKLEEVGAMEYTVIVNAPANAPASIQYLAPYTGCAVGEYFMYKGQHALVMYDDLSKHAVAYRQISLLLRRPPGREAYPGDIFYLHSRLLERSAKLSEELGGGSLTAIPVVEIQAGDLSTYIPTNVISITDGQIYLETDLFNAGVRPAINAGISVSRVGGNAQTKAMKKVAGMLRLGLAQYKELETFAKFGTELDKETRKQLARGEKTVEILKQNLYQPIPVEDQVLVIFALTRGYLDDIEIKTVKHFEHELISYMHNSKKEIMRELSRLNDITDELEKLISEAIENFRQNFIN
ncbi:MAG: F0F1 ATP synthase subunit alpha [Actinobacteria bacterium]|nr:F0F1 ATP synthase subunit alpha [Actinomycetota bacterium]